MKYPYNVDYFIWEQWNFKQTSHNWSAGKPPTQVYYISSKIGSTGCPIKFWLNIIASELRTKRRTELLITALSTTSTELVTTELWKTEFFENWKFFCLKSKRSVIQKFSLQKFSCQEFSCQEFSCQDFSCQDFSCQELSCQEFRCLLVKIRLLWYLLAHPV